MVKYPHLTEEKQHPYENFSTIIKARLQEGESHEEISKSLKISLIELFYIIRKYDKEPEAAQRFLSNFNKNSAQFRCHTTRKLIFRNCEDSGISIYDEEIGTFCKRSLAEITSLLPQKTKENELLNKAAECLSVFDVEKYTQEFIEFLEFLSKSKKLIFFKHLDSIWAAKRHNLLKLNSKLLNLREPRHIIISLTEHLMKENQNEMEIDRAIKNLHDLLGYGNIEPELALLIVEAGKYLNESKLDSLIDKLNEKYNTDKDNVVNIELKLASDFFKNNDIKSARKILHSLWRDLSLKTRIHAVYNSLLWTEEQNTYRDYIINREDEERKAQSRSREVPISNQVKTASQYGKDPISVKCPFCQYESITDIKQRYGPFACVSCLGLSLLTGFQPPGILFASGVVSLCPIFHDIQHRCRQCNSVLGTYKNYL